LNLESDPVVAFSGVATGISTLGGDCRGSALNQTEFWNGGSEGYGGVVSISQPSCCFFIFLSLLIQKNNNNLFTGFGLQPGRSVVVVFFSSFIYTIKGMQKLHIFQYLEKPKWGK
jgi:hypothetical protein